jgi:hypothetical protein
MTAVSMLWRFASILDVRTFAAFWGDVSLGRRWAQGGDGVVSWGEDVHWREVVFWGMDSGWARGLTIPWGGDGAGDSSLGRRWGRG